MPFESNPLAFYGRNIIQDYHTRLRAKLSVKAGQSDSFDVPDDELRFLPENRVGILGAGIGGLYTALILDSLDIEYEILEASDRTGGRMFTYKFPGGGRYDYYDAGAMRFPFPKKDSQGRYKNGVMKRLAELIEYGPLNQGRGRVRDNLIPFYPQARDSLKPGFNYYNGIREPVSNAPKGPFGAQEMDVDADYIRAGVDAIVDDVTRSFTRMLVQDIETRKRKGWEVLMANDLYTGRSYMATKYLPSAHLELPPEHLPNNVINWCGLLRDECEDALVEIVFDSLAFTKIGDTDYADVEWKCFEGGSETLPKKIEEYLNKKGCFIRFDKRVTALSQGHMTVDIPISFSDHQPPCAEELLDDRVDLVVDQDKVIDDHDGPRRSIIIPRVSVTVNGNETHNYSHVISTLPLSVLRTVDLSGAGLNIMQKNALRSLAYDPSTKIAILFKSNWWTTKLGIVGGQTFTDLPICSIVYPSHGVDSDTPSKVLIASFSWKSDSNRLGSLATTKSREVLLDLVLRNLAEIHKGLHPDVTYEYLKEEVVDMHVQDWNRGEYAIGAYAYFAPGQFQDLYASLTYPAASKRLHFAGEAVSTHHAWVVGALDSSWRAVYEYLKVTWQDEKIRKFKMLWGESSEWANMSPLTEGAKENDGRDLLDQHLGLVDHAIRDRIIR
ncbi:amine oxidase [Imleria badia]|nr:amine oxidase [Imleria badia]